MFLLLKLFIFIYRFSAKETCVFLASEAIEKSSEFNTLSQKNDEIFQIIEQIKVSRVPLCIVQAPI